MILKPRKHARAENNSTARICPMSVKDSTPRVEADEGFSTSGSTELESRAHGRTLPEPVDGFAPRAESVVSAYYDYY
jgi:hypothetical protein